MSRSSKICSLIRGFIFQTFTLTSLSLLIFSTCLLRCLINVSSAVQSVCIANMIQLLCTYYMLFYSPPNTMCLQKLSKIIFCQIIHMVFVLEVYHWLYQTLPGLHSGSFMLPTIILAILGIILPCALSSSCKIFLAIVCTYSQSFSLSGVLVYLFVL